MHEILLILGILAVFAGGYFAMGRIDRFLSGGLHDEPPAYQPRTPSCMMLTDRLSDEELIRTIRQFASEHGRISIILREKEEQGCLGGEICGNDEELMV